MGFIWCDGYIYKRERNNYITYEFKLSLASQDENHVIKFRDFLEADYEIKTYNFESSYGKGIEKRLLISNKYFAGLLYNKYGLVPNRTNVTKLIENVPCELYKDLIRGIIDAEGSILNVFTKDCSIGTSDKPYESYKSAIGISTYEDILTFIQEYLYNNKIINVMSKIYIRHEGKDANCRTIRYCGNIQVPRIINHIYIGSKVYLDRKYTKCLEILKMHTK